jgi:DNA-binding cell septation regulator SpoVG
MSIAVTVRTNNSGNPKAPVAYASAFVNEIFHIDGIKIWQNNNGLNVQMPGYSNTSAKNGKKYYNQYFRYDSRRAQFDLEETIIKAYKEELAIA